MLHMEAREPGRCARAAPALLAHLSLLFVLYGGALLATGARLRWDPSAYVAARALLPAAYRVLRALLPAAALALLALAHLALAALAARRTRTRRRLYLIYAICTGVALLAELVFGAVAAVYVREWLRTDVALQLQQTLEVREHLLQLLAALERWHPLPNQIKALLQEAEADLPWNVYVSCAAAAVLLLAQAAALVLALVARRDIRAHTRARHSGHEGGHRNNGVRPHRHALLEPGFRRYSARARHLRAAAVSGTERGLYSQKLFFIYCDIFCLSG